MRPAARMLLSTAAVLLALAACGGAAAGPDERGASDGTGAAPGAGGSATSVTAPAVTLPPAGGGFDYQLGGAYDPQDGGPGPAELSVVVRDASAGPLPGAYSVCYVNGFQTQPDQQEQWLARPDLLLHDDSGELLVDPEWPDENILDPSTAAQREGILDVLGPVITGCADAGFDAVEIDNLDTWTRFPQIDEAGARALAAAYTDLAHEHGLAIAQKNAAEVAPIARTELGFDFAVTEECGRYDECAAYTDVYGEHVLQIEYPGSLAEEGMDFAAVCALPDRAPHTILRDLDLVAPGEAGYVYESC